MTIAASCVLRMLFGSTDAREVFQNQMEKLFGDIAEISVDDICIHAPTKEEHDKKVYEYFVTLSKI